MTLADEVHSPRSIIAALIAGKKLIVIGLIALAALLKKFRGGKKSDEPAG